MPRETYTELKLGHGQTFCLDAMMRHGGRYRPGGFWVLDNHTITLRVMETLVARGLAEPVEGQQDTYQITEAGRALKDRLYVRSNDPALRSKLGATA